MEHPVRGQAQIDAASSSSVWIRGLDQVRVQRVVVASDVSPVVVVETNTEGKRSGQGPLDPE